MGSDNDDLALGPDAGAGLRCGTGQGATAGAQHRSSSSTVAAAAAELELLLGGVHVGDAMHGRPHAHAHELPAAARPHSLEPLAAAMGPDAAGSLPLTRHASGGHSARGGYPAGGSIRGARLSAAAHGVGPDGAVMQQSMGKKALLNEIQL